MEFQFNTVEEGLLQLRNGKIIIVTDDENRENEGDLICAAEFATPENINFMATYGRGLICMPMSEKLCQKLGLPQMVVDNEDPHSTAFSVSIDHVSTGTGISAGERSATAIACTDEEARPADFRRPGHMFPLMSKPGGVLVRPGHTEATVDLMRLAKLKECGVCCEIMAKDGTMMRLPQLMELAKEWGLCFITIKDLEHYRKCNDELVERIAVTEMPTRFGLLRAYAYVDNISGEHHVALVKGEIGDGSDVLCRLHSECLTGDAFGSLRCDCGPQLEYAVRQIEEQGRGVLLYMRQEGRGIGLVNKLRAYELQDKGMDTVEANRALGFHDDMREYHIGAQILRDIGVKSLNLLTNNPRKIHEISRFGIKVQRVSMQINPSEHNAAYMRTKKDKLGHLMNL